MLIYKNTQQYIQHYNNYYKHKLYIKNMENKIYILLGFLAGALLFFFLPIFPVKIIGGTLWVSGLRLIDYGFFTWQVLFNSVLGGLIGALVVAISTIASKK